MVWTATTLNLKDAAGTTQPVIAYTDGTNFSFAHPILDNTGAVIAPATQGTLASVLSALQAAIPAGTNIIGKLTTDQTTHGTTDLVAADITKVGGSATSLGQKAMASSFPVVFASDQSAIPAPIPAVITGTAITRPADTLVYAVGDLLVSSTTAATVNAAPTTAAVAKANDQAFTMLKCRLKKSGTVTTNAIFRVHCYKSAPTVTNGDNGVWLSTESGYLGAFDITIDRAFSDASEGVGVPDKGSTISGTPATGTQTIYFLIEVRAAYTPSSAEVFTSYFEIQ